MAGMNYGSPTGGQSVSFGNVGSPASGSLSKGTVDRANADAMRNAGEKKVKKECFLKRIFRSRKSK